MAKFEPASTWQSTDKGDTLSVKVPGFKREQLKVQVDSSGNLRVSGQGGDGRQPFSIDFRVPEGCNLGGIRARFDSDSETLVITLPKDEKATATAAAAAAPSPADKAETQKARQEKPTEPAAADKGAAASDAGAAAGAGRRQLGMRGPGRAMLVYTVVGVLVLVLAGVCFYLSYELRKATAGDQKKIVMGVPE